MAKIKHECLECGTTFSYDYESSEEDYDEPCCPGCLSENFILYEE
jgi:hypothetical protein